MKAVKTFALGAAGIVALVGASAPAAAQSFPGYNNPTNVIGQVLQSVLNPYGGYGQYGYSPYGNQYGYGANPQMAASQCTAAVQQQLQGRYAAGYGSPYGYNGYSNARVLGVTRIEPRSSGLRVRGEATSGMGYGAPYGGYGGYGGYGQSAADLTFRCDVDYRGYIRDVDIDRRY
jgi:hypothetical protein